MLRVASRRLLIAIPLILLVTFFVFVLIDIGPGDAADALASENATPEDVERIREELNLDDPLLLRYGQWLVDAARGDLGESFVTQQAVRSTIASKVWPTISLVMVSFVITLVVGGIAGVIGALRPRGAADRVVTMVSSLFIAVPPFWLGLMLVLLFAIKAHWLPALGYTPFGEDQWDWLRHLLLPGIALAALGAAELALQLKASLSEVLRRDYVLAARAKGMPKSTLVLKHGLKNAAVPVITVLGYRLAQLIGTTVIIESVFTIPGLGTLAISSTLSRDIPVMLGLVLVMTLVVVLVNVLVDISYAYFNPKIRT